MNTIAHLEECLDVTGIRRYSRSSGITTLLNGPRVSREELVADYRAAVALRDSLDECLYNMDMLLGVDSE
jgi:hypothetical protein